MFTRVTAARVFNPELIAATRVLQLPVTTISAEEQRVMKTELRDLGEFQAMALYSQVKQTAVGIGQGNDELMHTRKNFERPNYAGSKRTTNK